MTPTPTTLIRFTINGRAIDALVLSIPAADVPWYFVIDGDGQLYDRSPTDGWDPAPKSVRSRVAAATEAQLRRHVIQRRITLMLTGERAPRRARRISRRMEDPMPPPSLGRGRLARGDIPLRLAHPKSSRISPEMEARMVFTFDATRRSQLRAALRTLAVHAPKQHEAYVRCFLGDWPWIGPDGRVLTCPMPPAELGRVWGTGRANVTNALRLAHVKLIRALGWDPRDYLRPARQAAA